MLLAVIEGILLSFTLLMICVINIKNGPVGGVHYYEKDVRDRVVEMGLLTEKEIKRNKSLSCIPFFVMMILVCPVMVFFLNGASGFMEGFIQLLTAYMICNLFDRLFIDWYWVGHTKAWIIPGTEDLMPYIPKNALIRKWVISMIMYPVFAALLSFVFTKLALY
ncbi:hypothetical protein D6855_10475 [Butyrivibrio sp. CB08]|uniref:hypothetical protein n=1 Tax=Butyrivibrio sp. CB08 TaxID=2364879 RepID=UPI000EA8EF0B|nr:hypothetical protein [Butyrivibrio sp. CB08]RKM59319.1 hypothetical protein D6855_10475 [Butyrivibrio sp. CB08]